MPSLIALRDIGSSPSLWTPKYRETLLSFSVERYNRIDQAILEEAIRLTINTRRTILPEAPAIFQDDFSSDPRNQQLWNGFLKRIKAEEIRFADVISKITEQLYPIYNNLKK
jgi:hypothetical protein